MILDTPQKLSELIAKIVDDRVSKLPISYPCKVVSVDSEDKVFVEVETLLPKDKNDVNLKIPILQSPYLTLPIKEGDIGLALNCSYLFEKKLLGEDIETKLQTIRANGLFFVPLVSKDDFKGEMGITSIISQDNTARISLKENTIESIISKDDTLKTSIIQSDSEIKLKSSDSTKFEMSTSVLLQSGSTIEAKGVSATLGEILSDLITALNTLSLTQSTAPSTPVVLPPNFLTDLTAIQTKIKANFK